MSQSPAELADSPDSTAVGAAPAHRTPPGGLVLPASSVQHWLLAHMAVHYEANEEEPTTEPTRWTTLGELLADDGAGLEAARTKLFDEGTPPQVAAKYLAGWVGGSIGDAVGHLFALTGVGAVIDPSRLPVRQLDGGYLDRVDLSQCSFVAAEGHPWAGHPGVRVVDDEQAVCRTTLDAFLEVIGPVVTVAGRGVKMASPALWSEVADGLGMSLGYQPHLPVHEVAVRRTMMLLEAGGVPWRKHPSVSIGDTALGPSYLVTRGGCCFAYKARTADDHDNEEELDEEHLAYRARFGVDPPQKRYCGSCSLRPPQDVIERQLFWFERQALKAGAGAE